MLPASPFRHALTLGILGLGALLLWATRPRPAPSSAAGQSRSASCLSNLSQISRAYALYARDFNGKLPLAVDPEDRYNRQTWRAEDPGNAPYIAYVQSAPFLHLVLRPYAGSPTIFRCPSDVGWGFSRLQIDALSGAPTGLPEVRPSSFAKYGTSYYSWTIYGFNLLSVADIPDPERKTLLFDGDLWHQSGAGPRAGELFLDGHAAMLTKAQHDAAAPTRDF